MLPQSHFFGTFRCDVPKNFLFRCDVPKNFLPDCRRSEQYLDVFMPYRTCNKSHKRSPKMPQHKAASPPALKPPADSRDRPARTTGREIPKLYSIHKGTIARVGPQQLESSIRSTNGAFVRSLTGAGLWRLCSSW